MGFVSPPPSHSRPPSPRYTRLGTLLALGGFASAKTTLSYFCLATTRKYSRLGRVRGSAHPTLLIFSLVALASSPFRRASGSKPTPSSGGRGYRPHFCNQTKKTPKWVSFVWLRRWDLSARHRRFGGIFHCPLENIVVYGTAVPYTPYFLPCRPRFISHRERSGSKPTPSSGGRGYRPHFCNQTKKPPDWVVFVCARAIKKIFLPFCLRDLNLTGYSVSSSSVTSNPPINITFMRSFDSTTMHSIICLTT